MFIMRVATVHDVELDELPSELRSVLTAQDRAAIADSESYFAGLAERAEPKWLRRLLRKCADSGYELQFLAYNDAPYRPYYRFFWEGQPAVSLPRTKRLRSDLPPFLRHVYGLLGSVRENQFDESGGLHPGDTLGPVSETGMWVEPDGTIDQETAIPFLETFSGSQLCYLPDGTGAWLEASHFRKVRSLEREVAKYFEALVRGERALLDRD